MARLPQPGSDDGVWGDVLNNFLQVEHNNDGPLKASGSLSTKVDTSDGRLTDARIPVDGSVTDTKVASGANIAQSKIANLTSDLSSKVAKSTFWLNIKDYGAQGDGVADDTSAIQAAIAAVPSSGGCVYFPKGAYVTSSPLNIKSNLRICGDAWGRAKILNTSSDVFNMNIGSLVDKLEIDHLAIDVTNGNAFYDADIIRASFHHLDIYVRSANKAVWHAPSVALMIECYFSEIQYRVYGATRSVPAWNLISSGIDLITQNVWEKIIAWNNDNDATQYQFFVSCTNANGANRNNVWRDVTFEQACGGCIKLESATGTLIDGCWSWDTPSNSITQNLFAIAKQSGNALVPRNTHIRSSGRVGDGLQSGIYDIALSSTCLQTSLDNVSGSTTQPLRVNIGGSTGAFLNNVQVSATVDGVNSGNYAYTQRGQVRAQAISTADTFYGSGLDTGGTRSIFRGDTQDANQRLLTGSVSGDANARVVDYASGKREWGDGTNARDTNLYRSAASTLQTDGALTVSGVLTTPGGITSAGNASFSGRLTASSGVQFPASTRTGAVSLTTGSPLIELCNATSGAFTVTLPSANASLGQTYTIKKIDSSANAVTISRAGTDTIEGATTYALAAQYKYATLVSGGSGVWYITASN